MATTAEIAARLAELKISTGTHEHAATWIRAAIRELKTALGWATHLDRIEAANPGHESAERDNAARWITDHLERGERIAREAGAHLPEPTTEVAAPAAALHYTNRAGVDVTLNLARYTTDAARHLAAIVRRRVADGTWCDATVVTTDGTVLGLDSIPEPAADPIVYTITYVENDIRRTRHVPADRIRPASELLMGRAEAGIVWDIEARDQTGRDITFDIPAFCA